MAQGKPNDEIILNELGLKSILSSYVPEEENKIDLEINYEHVIIAAADDSETVCIFDTENLGSKPNYSCKIK